MPFPNTAQEQLFSIPKIPICGGGYIIKGCFLSVLHPLTCRRFSQQQKTEQFITLMPYDDYLHINTLLQYSENICGSFTWKCWCWGPGRMGFFPVCDCIYIWSSAASPQFCLKLIVPPFTVSFASSQWGLPSEPGTHYSPSWIQTLQSDASSTTWGFHSWKPL